jgi:hypothetical protein
VRVRSEKERENARAYSRAYYYSHKEQNKAYHKEYIAANPDKQARYRATGRSKQYGMTADARHAMYQAQGRACYLCRAPIEEWGRSTHVDHDHSCCPRGGSCGKCIRGLACHDCNTHLIPLIEKGHSLVAHLSVLLDQ